MTKVKGYKGTPYMLHLGLYQLMYKGKSKHAENFSLPSNDVVSSEETGNFIFSVFIVFRVLMINLLDDDMAASLIMLQTITISVPFLWQPGMKPITFTG
jgi:hypothetical protein